jgi:hypothetical protein
MPVTPPDAFIGVGFSAATCSCARSFSEAEAGSLEADNSSFVQVADEVLNRRANAAAKNANYCHDDQLK